MSFQIDISDLITVLNRPTNSLSEIKGRIKKIEQFTKNYKDFYRTNVGISANMELGKLFIPVLNLCFSNNKKHSTDHVDAFIRFFSILLDVKSCILSREELREIRKKMKEIVLFIEEGPSIDVVMYWVNIFNKIVYFPFFFNIFASFKHNGLFVSLFSVFYKTIQFFFDGNIEYGKSLLEFINSILKLSPFSFPSSYVENFFEISEIVLNKCQNKNVVMNILSEMLVKFPITTVMRDDAFKCPFSKMVFDSICPLDGSPSMNIEDIISTNRFLNIFLEYNRILGRKINNSYLDMFYKFIFRRWKFLQSRTPILSKHDYVPYLRFDIEIMKQYGNKDLLKSINELRRDSDLLLLLIGFAQFYPDFLLESEWIELFNKLIKKEKDISSCPSSNIFRLYSKACCFINNSDFWENIYIYESGMMNLIKNEISDQYFQFLTALFSNMRLSQVFVSNNQNKLWESIKETNLSCERMEAIHNMIYHYGFSNFENRSSCFNTIWFHLTQEMPKQQYKHKLIKSIVDVVSSISSVLPTDLMNHDSSSFFEMKEITAIRKFFPLFSPKTDIDDSIIIEDKFLTSINGELFFSDKYKESKVLNNDSIIRPSTNYIANPHIFQIAYEGLTHPCIFDKFLIIVHIISHKISFYPVQKFVSEVSTCFNSSNVEDFSSFIPIFVSIMDFLPPEVVYGFFDSISSHLIIIFNSYIHSIIDELNQFFVNSHHMVFAILETIGQHCLKNKLSHLGLFIKKYSFIAPLIIDSIIDSLTKLLQVLENCPELHIELSKSIVSSFLDSEKYLLVFQSITNMFINLYNYEIPLSQFEIILQDILLIFEDIICENSESIRMIQVFYTKFFTPFTKEIILKFISKHFCSLYHDLIKIWEDKSWKYTIDPVFFLSNEQGLKLESINVLSQILSVKHINGSEYFPNNLFNRFILPVCNLSILADKSTKEPMYFYIHLMIMISYKVSTLTYHCLDIVLSKLTQGFILSFPRHSYMYMLGLYENHYLYESYFKELYPHFKYHPSLSISEMNSHFLSHRPGIFFDNISSYLKLASPYVIPSLYTHQDKDLLILLSLKNQNEKNLVEQNFQQIYSYCSYYLLKDSDNSQKYKFILSKIIEFCPEKYIETPEYLFNLEVELDQDALFLSYKSILKFTKSDKFTDIRYFLFKFYYNTWNAKHELTKNEHIKKLYLYIQLVFRYHESLISSNHSLFVDLISVANKIYNNYEEIACSIYDLLCNNIPDKLTKYDSFFKQLEDYCLLTGSTKLITNIEIQIPDILDHLMLFPELFPNQSLNRTLTKEILRIYLTKRLNQNGIRFLTQQVMICINSGFPIDYLDLDLMVHRVSLSIILDYYRTNRSNESLFLYSTLFNALYMIHPSPNTFSGTIKANDSLLVSLLECLSSTNADINMAALNAIRKIISSCPPDYFHLFKDYNGPNYDSIGIITIKKDQPWIKRVLVSLMSYFSIEEPLYHCQELASLSIEFCHSIFSYVYISLSKIKYYKRSIPFLRLDDELEYTHQEMKVFLDGISSLKNYCFSQKQPLIGLSYVNWNDNEIDFAKISKLCLDHGDPYSAYLYAEFSNETSYIVDHSKYLEIFIHLNHPELSYEIGIPSIDSKTLINLHILEGKYERALELVDNNLYSNYYCKILHALQLDNIILQSLPESNHDSLWKLQKWDIPYMIVSNSKNSFDKDLYLTMQSFASKDINASKINADSLLSRFCINQHQSIDEIYSSLLLIQSVIWHLSIIDPKSSFMSEVTPDITLSYENWLNLVIKQSSMRFHCIEPSMSLNAVFIANGGFFDNGRIIPTELKYSYFSKIIESSVLQNKINNAQYYLLIAKSQGFIQQFIDLQQLNVLFRDYPIRAVSVISNRFKELLIPDDSPLSKNIASLLNVELRFKFSQWSLQTQYRQFSSIITDLSSVVSESDSMNQNSINTEALITIARASHNMYNECHYYVNNTEFLEQIKNVNDMWKDLNSVTSRQNSKQFENGIHTHINHFQQTKENMLVSFRNAILNYINILSKSDKYDLISLYSFVNLWFNNSLSTLLNLAIQYPNIFGDIQLYEFYGSVISNNIDRIPPKKLVSLFYQLAARLKSQKNITSDDIKILNNIIMKICSLFPDPCFPTLFVLTRDGKNKLEDNKINDIVHQIENDNILSESWIQMQELLKNYIQLSSSCLYINKELLLDTVSPFFASINTTNRRSYKVITSNYYPSIVSIENKVSILDGISTPMLITLKGQDGIVYKQVLKGKRDDLRQDCVMQQIFVLSSNLLEAQNPNLKIRSYKVIPLSSECGVIEFVQNTQSFLAQILKLWYRYPDKSKIPDINVYRDIDKNYREVSLRFHKFQDKNRHLKSELINLYQSILKDNEPVFRFFFVQNFPNPCDWFLARLRYCYQTATNSILGFVLGIGDRHCCNILIDDSNGSVVHIDLGIAFDQGKTLSIRENVPFRLTHNIVDGMGHCGGTGVFRHACESTLRILRNNSDHLLTVLDVFIRDPLHTWKITRDDKFEVKTAESIIISCKRKLEGKEAAEALSVEGQVAKLISEAKDPERLALMFSGWRPYI